MKNIGHFIDFRLSDGVYTRMTQASYDNFSEGVNTTTSIEVYFQIREGLPTEFTLYSQLRLDTKI